MQVRDKGHHILAKPGDRIPIAGIDVQVLTSAGEEIASPLPGAGAVNRVCASTPPHLSDPSENAQSIGTLITFGKFRIIDLGDLTWNKEMELACPNNKIGTVDVYLSTHHGLDASNCPAIVYALRPRVAIVNNGETKGARRKLCGRFVILRELRMYGSCITQKMPRKLRTLPSPSLSISIGT